MSDQSNKTDEWQPCPSGQITGMVQRLQTVQRSIAIRRVAVPAVATMLLVVAGAYFSFSQSQPGGVLFRPGGLSCGEVQKHLSGDPKQPVSPEFSKQLEEHLADYPECRKMHEKMGGRVEAPSLQARANGEGEPRRLALAARR